MALLSNSCHQARWPSRLEEVEEQDSRAHSVLMNGRQRRWPSKIEIWQLDNSMQSTLRLEIPKIPNPHLFKERESWSDNTRTYKLFLH